MGVPPLTSSMPRRRIRLRCFIRDQFVRPLICDHHSKAAGKCPKTGGFALAPQRFCLLGSSFGLSNRSATEERAHFARNGDGRSNDTIIHPRVTAWYKLGDGRGQNMTWILLVTWIIPRSHYRPNNWALNCRAYFFLRCIPTPNDTIRFRTNAATKPSSHDR
jgi:hypothetical protein